MPAQSDGYMLNAHLRSQYGTPTRHMVDLLTLLEADMRMARSGRNVLTEQWVQWIRQDRHRMEAIFRVLCLVVAVRGMTADDVSKLRHDFQSTLSSKHRPKPSRRETGPRESDRLW